jgi:signal transduction histidine kinase
MLPTTHRSLLMSALIWPLLITVVLLGALSLVSVYEQQRLVDENTELQVQAIAERSQRLARTLDFEIRHAELSVQAYRDEIRQQSTAQNAAQRQANSDALQNRVSLARDGAYRTRVDAFDAELHAGVWLPKYIEWQAEFWPLLAISEQVTQSFGRGAAQRSFVDTWFMPAFGGIVIYWPTEPEFIYRASADFDYRPSEWVQLTTPSNNPERITRWTNPSFDEIAQLWMISVVSPLYINEKWWGAVGHDVLLNDVLKVVAADANDNYEQFLLLSNSAQLLASSRYNEQLIAQQGKLTLDQINEPQITTLVTQLGEQQFASQQNSDSISFAHRLGNNHFILVHQVSLLSVTEIITRTLARSKWLVVAALLMQLLLTIVIGFRSYRRAIRDFNDLDAIQDRLRVALTDAAYNNREISAISYGISHDLRAPLRHLTGFTQMLREQSLMRLNGDDLSLVHKIESAARRAIRLTEKLLTYLRMAQQETRCKEINLQSLLERVVVEIVAEWPSSKVEWQLNGHVMIYADPAMLRELFYQLFDNALAAVNQQSQPLICVDTEKMSHALRIVVRDNGVGFPEERAEHLFEMFQRLNAEQTRGPGVGLAIARRIVERHFGKIHAHSQLNAGSEFIIELPLSPR